MDGEVRRGADTGGLFPSHTETWGLAKPLAKYPFQGRKPVKATSLLSMLLQPAVLKAKAERALGQVQGEHSCEAG